MTASTAVAEVRSFPARFLVFCIELYRTYVSPLRMPTCRFTPTCSEYAVESLREHGAIKGSVLAVVRLVKCAPWHPGGWDPVPARRQSWVDWPRRQHDHASQQDHATASVDEQRGT